MKWKERVGEEDDGRGEKVEAMTFNGGLRVLAVHLPSLFLSWKKTHSSEVDVEAGESSQILHSLRENPQDSSGELSCSI